MMLNGAYTYDPGRIPDMGKDRMRFELGDTMVEGGADTSALTDEEIEAALAAHPRSWKRAKLLLLESLYRRFAFEVNTRTGPLTLELQERAKQWKKDYDDLKKEVAAESCSVPWNAAGGSSRKPPYFYTGMQENPMSHRG